MNPGYEAHRRTDQVLAGIVNDRKRERPLGQRQADRQQQRTAGRRGENRNQYQERHHGEILQQQNPERNPAVRQMQFVLLGQQLGDDRGGRQRQGAADRERGLPAETEINAQRHGAQRGYHDLHDTDSQDDVTHSDQAGHRNLQPDREQQENHAHLGDLLEGVRVLQPAEGVLPGKHPHQQVSEYRGNVNPFEECDADDR